MERVGTVHCAFRKKERREGVGGQHLVEALRPDQQTLTRWASSIAALITFSFSSLVSGGSRSYMAMKRISTRYCCWLASRSARRVDSRPICHRRRYNLLSPLLRPPLLPSLPSLRNSASCHYHHHHPRFSLRSRTFFDIMAKASGLISPLSTDFPRERFFGLATFAHRLLSFAL